MNSIIIEAFLNPKHTIAKNLVFFIVGLSACFSFAISLVQLGFDYRHGLNEVEESVAYLESVSSKSLGNAIWYLDSIQINTILTGIRELPNVAGVELLSNMNDVEKLERDKRDDTRYFPIFFQTSSITKQVGLLIVKLDLDQLYMSLVEKFGVGLFGNIIKTLAVSSLFVLYVRRRITMRLGALGEYASKVALGGRKDEHPLEYADLFNPKRDDEITELYEQIRLMENRLAENFEEAQKQERRYAERLENEINLQREKIVKNQGELVEASRRAGMAEVAIGFLHNIGNIMTSMFVSCDTATKTFQNNRYGERVSSAMKLMTDKVPALNEYLKGDEGQKLEQFLSMIKEEDVKSRKESEEAIFKIGSGLRDIEEIVKLQMSYSKGPEIRDSITISGLIEKASEVNKMELVKHQVNFKVDIEEDVEFKTVPVKVSQILVNLVLNSIQAFPPDKEGREITVTGGIEDDYIYFSCKDNGIGISQENLVRIFSFGFTTKTKGSGFGLHSSSLMAQELGGKLDVSSEGEGLGATFTLYVPYAKEQAA